MEKKKAIAKITIISIFAILLMVFSIISFMPNNWLKGFSGFAGAIDKGFDLEGGIYANYTPVKINDEMTDEEFNIAVEETYKKVNALIQEKGYTDANVYLTSNNKLRIESPNKEDAQSILSLIGSGELKIRTTSSSSSDVEIKGSHITAAFAMQDPTTYYWGTYIGLNEEGKEKLSSLTKNLTGSQSINLYFFRGNSDSYFFQLPVSSHISEGFLFISSSTGSMSSEDALNLAIQVSTGSYDVELIIDGNVGEISPSAGQETILGLILAGSISLLMILIVFIVVYRELGLITLISIFLYTGLALFFMQAIPVITLSSTTVGGILLGVILISACHFIILNKIKSEYLIGKKLKTSIKTGIKKSLPLIIEICGACALISIIMFFVCTGTMKSFSMIALTCSILCGFITLFFTYHLFKSYSTLNETKGKRVNFYREDTVDEIE